MWLHHFWNLLGRSWGAAISALGTTTLGFLLLVVFLTALLWFAVVLGTWLNLRRMHTARPFNEVLGESLWSGLFSAAGIVLIIVVSYSYYFVHTVYEDHQALVSYVTNLDNENKTLSRELELRKHTLVTNEPVFSNTTALLMAFGTYRHARNGKPCAIMLTAPKSSRSPLPMVVSGLSNSVSDCTTFGPMNSDIDPDVEKQAMDGMIPNEVVFHADRNSKAADRLFNSLEGLLPVRRSYDMPSAADQTHRYGIPNPAQTEFIWLQFGTDATWNEQQRSK